MPSDAVLARTPGAEVDPDDAAEHCYALTHRLSESDLRRRFAAFPVPSYRPTPAQTVFHADSRRDKPDVTVLNCGRRSGKSVGCAAEEVDRQQRDMVDKLRGRGRWEGDPHPTWERGQGRSPEPFLHYLSVAPTYPMLGPNKRAAQKMAGGLVSEGGIITSQTDQTWWYLGGIRRDWKSAERPERVGVGEGVDGISIDEAARVKPALWDDHAQPALADHGGWALIRSTPMGKASWFYRVWALGDPEAANDIAESTGEDIAVDPHARCFHWTTMDNTAVPRLIEWAERMKRRMPLAMWRRNFAASWAAFVGQCLDLDETRHRRRADIKLGIQALQAGIDCGYSSPGVFSIWGMDWDGRWHELESVSRTRLQPHLDRAWRERDGSGSWSAVARNILNRAGRAYLGMGGREVWRRIPFYMPADPPGNRALYESLGFNVHAAYQDKRARLTYAQMALGDDGVTIRTGVMWRSWESLKYPDNAVGDKAEIWDKTQSDDHAFDAAAYALSPQVREGYHPRHDGPSAAAGWHGV